MCNGGIFTADYVIGGEMYMRTRERGFVPLVTYSGSLYQCKADKESVSTVFDWKNQIRKLAKDFCVKTEKIDNIISETEKATLPHDLAYYNSAHKKLMAII